MNKRDISIIPFQKETSLVFASDNSGCIGLKELDQVKVHYDIVSYYGFRVALMELLAVGAQPITLIVHSFNGDEAWSSLVNGANRIIAELELDDLEVTGSSESNFSLLQSASSFIVAGTVLHKKLRIGRTLEDAKFAVVGEPLAGEEVMCKENKILPLRLFKELLAQEEVYEIIPVGSKGILYELHLLTDQQRAFTTDLTLTKSAGPATCVVISYSPNVHDTLEQICGAHFHPLGV
jgi:hypothetical protein